MQCKSLVFESEICTTEIISNLLLVVTSLTVILMHGKWTFPYSMGLLKLNEGAMCDHLGFAIPNGRFVGLWRFIASLSNEDGRLWYVHCQLFFGVGHRLRGGNTASFFASLLAHQYGCHINTSLRCLHHPDSRQAASSKYNQKQEITKLGTWKIVRIIQVKIMQCEEFKANELQNGQKTQLRIMD